MAKRRVRTQGVPISPRKEDRVSVGIRRISNGYIEERSVTTARTYKSTETYHPTKPKVAITDTKAEKS